MTKVTGQYASLLRGVSQQSPNDRLEGQHGDVVNLLSDPVRGLVRRNGMILEAAQYTAAPVIPQDAISDSFSFRTFEYQDSGIPLDLIYRSRARNGAQSVAHLNALNVYNKQDRTFKVVKRPVTDAILDAFESGGISSIINVGDYVLFAANSVTPSLGVVNQMAVEEWATTGAVWIRGGNYATTYSIAARKASTNTVYNASFTTMKAAYDGILDFSSVPYSDPDYQQKINELQAAYDTAVNTHIADASDSIVPGNIAQELIDALTGAGFTGWTRNGSHIFNDDVDGITLRTTGNEDHMRYVLSDVRDSDEVTAWHRVGKVVRVTPKEGSESSYYLKAFPQQEGATGFQKVIWRETAGAIQTPNQVLAIGRYYEGVFYWASDSTKLAALILAENGDTVEVPQFVASNAGDSESVPAPNFFGKRITLLTVFQDRLLIGSGGVINASEIGDYFNFFPTTVLTVPDSDPLEMYALGTEGDTIRRATTYDKNLQLYGDKFHYAVSGRVPLTASAPAMSVQFNIDQTAYAQPVGAGNYLFMLKEDAQLGSSRLLQVQAGLFQDNPQIRDVSLQLRDYINGTPAELVSLTNPSTLFIRTEHFLHSNGAYPKGRPFGLYVYQYLDNAGGERVFDAFSTWEWSTALGTPVGISSNGLGDGIMLYTAAFGLNSAGVASRGLLALRASARPDPSGLPYLDGLVPAAQAEAGGLYTPSAQESVRLNTFTSTSAAHSFLGTINLTDQMRWINPDDPNYSVGDAPAQLADPFRWIGVNGWRSTYIAANPTAPSDALWTGLGFPAYVDLTNPVVRDHNGKPKNLGSLKLTKLHVTTTRTAGIRGQWTDYSGTKTPLLYDTGYERINYKHSVFIGRDTRYVNVRLSAVDWLPLTINAISWQGDWFPDKR